MSEKIKEYMREIMPLVVALVVVVAVGFGFFALFSLHYIRKHEEQSEQCTFTTYVMDAKVIDKKEETEKVPIGNITGTAHGYMIDVVLDENTPEETRQITVTKDEYNAIEIGDIESVTVKVWNQKNEIVSVSLQ